MESKLTLSTLTGDLNPITPYKEYGGIFKLEKQIVIFNGHTVPLRNISQVLSYTVRPIFIKLPALLYIFFIAILCFTLSNALDVDKGGSSTALPNNSPFANMPSMSAESSPVGGFVKGCRTVMFFCLLAIGYAIWERIRPVIYGFTIELTSGSNYPFVNKKQSFIDEIYAGFTAAIRENKDFEANFEKLTINQGPFSGSVNPVYIEQGANTGQVSGGSASVESNTQNNKGDFAGSYNPVIVGNDTMGSVTGGSVTINKE